MDRLNLRERVQQGHHWKQAVTNDFLRGVTVTEIANSCACSRKRIEQVLREAIVGLSNLIPKPGDEAKAATKSQVTNQHTQPCGCVVVTDEAQTFINGANLSSLVANISDIKRCPFHHSQFQDAVQSMADRIDAEATRRIYKDAVELNR